jgi:hypothetical protein
MCSNDQGCTLQFHPNPANRAANNERDKRLLKVLHDVLSEVPDVAYTQSIRS